MLDIHNVIMPNHVHGIVVINKMDDGSDNRPNMQRDDGYPDESNMETQNLASLQSKSQSQQPKNQFKPQSRNYVLATLTHFSLLSF